MALVYILVTVTQLQGLFFGVSGKNMWFEFKVLKLEDQRFSSKDIASASVSHNFKSSRT